MNPWITLVLAGCFEVGFTTFMKLSAGFAKWPSMIGFAVCALSSFGLLTKAASTIPLGTALVGIVFFKDSTDTWRLVFLTTLIGSIIGLKFLSPPGP